MKKFRRLYTVCETAFSDIAKHRFLSHKSYILLYIFGDSVKYEIKYANSALDRDAHKIVGNDNRGRLCRLLWLRSEVDLPYYWIFVKPDLRAADPTEDIDAEAVTERVQDVDTVFIVDPEAGVLPSGKTVNFMLTFAPTLVRVMI